MKNALLALIALLLTPSAHASVTAVGAVTITATSVSDASLVLTANGSATPTCQASGQIQFKAVGNATAKDYTAMATWSTGDSTMASAAPGGMVSCKSKNGPVQVKASFP